LREIELAENISFFKRSLNSRMDAAAKAINTTRGGSLLHFLSFPLSEPTTSETEEVTWEEMGVKEAVIGIERRLNVSRREVGRSS